ncbi:MAG TPA: hypothetical protein VH395_08650 [Jatrophihabitantaceae bacterium]|jgi:hypothetical protein
MPGIEFLSEEPADAGSVEVLDTGPRRRPPRWLLPLGVAVVAAMAGLVLLNQDSYPPRSAAVTSPVPSPSVRLPLGLTLADGIGEPLQQVAGQPALDVAVAGVDIWVLESQRIVGIIATGASGIVTEGAIPGRPLGDEFNDAAARLVLDVPAGRIWVVVEGDARGRAIEYDATTLVRMREVDSLGLIQGAAALDGHLYVTSGERLIDIAPGRGPVTYARVSSQLGAVVADTARRRLLMADFGMPTRVWAIYPAAADQVAPPVRINLTKATLAVSSGAIWIAGFDTGGGTLLRLDPKTLHPIRHSPTEGDLHPGAIAVGSGVAVIWVRPGSSDASELDCVDAAGGELLQSWQVQGPVASVGATALVATPEGPVPLDLAGCSG